jgi:hypothetical protein
MLSDGRFWVGVFVGVLTVYGWHMYKARKAG